MKAKIFVMVSLIMLILASCTPTAKRATPKTNVPVSTSSSTALPPAIVPVQNLATPTEYQLPFNEKNAEREYCQLPIVKLSTSDAQGFSENEIAGKLMDLHLAYFNSSQAPDWCRIDRYNIGKIYYDERTPYLPLQPKGDIMRVVHYSIKLIQVPSFWMSLAGTIDKQNWLHSIADVAIFRLAYGYTMQFAYP